MRLDLSRKAQTDLDDIRDHSVGRFGTRKAIAYLDMIEQAFRRIVAYPQIGAAHDWLDGLRSLKSGEHRIYYIVGDETITVVRVLHTAMDAERHFS